MKKTFYLLFLMIITFYQSQDINKLKDANGFREIKLGSHISSNPHFVKKSEGNEKYFGAWGFQYNYILDQGSEKNYSKLGESKISRIFVKVDEDNIYKISLTLEKNYEVIEMLKYAYGKPSFENIELGLFRWTTDNDIECEVMGFSNFSNYFITYTDKNRERTVWQKEKNQKIQKAISEF